MFGIGQFAQSAKVSVRKPGHHDDVGLLRPASVDAAAGYRSYAAAQLRSLNRVLVLKDLGFTPLACGRRSSDGTVVAGW